MCEEPACQSRRCKRRRLDPWVRKIPWRRAWQPTPVFSPGESHGERSLAGDIQYIGLLRVRHNWHDLAHMMYLQDKLLCYFKLWTSLVTQMIKDLPEIQETRFRSLGQEDPPEKGMATHPSILAMDGRAWQATVHGDHKESDMTEQPTHNNLN